MMMMIMMIKLRGNRRGWRRIVEEAKAISEL
jgi:hypothetical protein